MTPSNEPATCLRVALNTAGRDFVVGDVHGHFELLDAFMAKVGFDVQRDRLFAVGDLVDRGPGSHQVVEWLDQPWFYSVRGNHEQMILDHDSGGGSVEQHRNNGGAWYHDAEADLRALVAQSLAQLPFALDIETSNGRVGIMHAEPPLLPGQHHWDEILMNLAGEQGGDVQQLTQRQALYSRSRINNRDKTPITGVDIVYVGHTSVAEPMQLGNVVYLDTGCSWPDGRLSAIEMATGAVIITEYGAT
jgi:serine/threonine protein phosphatase 1